MPKPKSPPKKKVNIERHTLNQVLDDQQIRASLQFGDSRLPYTDPETDDVSQVNITIDADTQPPRHKGMGWLRELPDFRDYDIHTEIDEPHSARAPPTPGLVSSNILSAAPSTITSTRRDFSSIRLHAIC